MLIAFFLIFLTEIYAFNIDTNNPIVYEDAHKYLFLNSNKSAYFGYSVVLFPGTRTERPWILVGAPRGGNQKKTGVIFKCGIMEKCVVLNTDTHPDKYVEKLDGAWIGGEMDVNYKTQRVVACGHRWTKVRLKNSGDISDYLMEGACYWFHTNDSTVQKLVPLIDPNRAVQGDSQSGGAVYNYGQGLAGFSVHMPRKEPEILLGAPGVYNWDGTAALVRDGEDSSPVANRLRQSRYAEPNEFSRLNIANAQLTTETLAYDLLGYSSTSGYFFSKSKLSYVSGAPKSHKYKGQVLIYNFQKVSEQALDVHLRLYGEQFGEYFGGSVTSGDVNGDQFDDLIVGAPFYTDKKYNEGKVYIFIWKNKNLLQPSKRDTIMGQAPNGQFGSTVQYLGDINLDGFGDVAVAAPYEEDTGVVYLYRGTTNGLEQKHCQRIVGRDINPLIRGFGSGISRAADIDFNGFADVAIGAYLSGHVVLLRSLPIVTIYQTLESQAAHLDFRQKNFEMSACFSYHIDQKLYEQVTIERSIVVDEPLGRANLRSSGYVKQIVLISNQMVCENFTVDLETSFSNRYDPISVTLSHVLKTKTQEKGVVFVARNVEGVDHFCPRCYVYNSFDSIHYSSLKIPFALGCGSDNLCKSDLRITPRTDLRDDTFVLGSSDYIMLETVVENLGERAFLTQMMVTLPEFVYFRSTPSACSEFNSSAVLCSVDNPLETKAQKSVVLDIDMTSSGRKEDSVVFIIQVLTSSENVGEEVKHLVVKLKREADVTITGKSKEQSYSFRNSTEKPNFTQIYQVETFGSSDLNELAVEIDVPFAFQNNSNTNIFLHLFPPLGTNGNDDVTCRSNFTYVEVNRNLILEDYSVTDEVINRTKTKRSVSSAEVGSEFEDFANRTFSINCSTPEVACSKVWCFTGLVKPGQVVKIELKMLLDVAAIEGSIGKKDAVLVATRGRVFVKNPLNFVQSGDKPDSGEVGSLFVFVGETEAEKVNLWIIVVSAVAGLLLLLLFVLGLVKVGFFKRTTKEELEQLKKEELEQLKKEMENNEVDNLTYFEQKEEES